MKYYLSGAITKQPNFKEYFQTCENKLRQRGIENIFNPASVIWPEDAQWKNCMKYDLKILIDCDCLVLLPNWRSSKGTKFEKYICKKLEIPIINFYDLLAKGSK